MDANRDWLAKIDQNVNYARSLLQQFSSAVLICLKDLLTKAGEDVCARIFIAADL